MTEENEWQKSEAHRRAGPTADEPIPQSPEGDRERHAHLTQEQVERIEEQERDAVAANPNISDS